MEKIEEGLDPYSGENRLYGGPTEFFKVVSSGDSKGSGEGPVILLGVRWAGIGAALSPVMARLADEGENVECFADGDGKQTITAKLGERLKIVSENDNDHPGLEFKKARSGNPLIRLGKLAGSLGVLVSDFSMIEWDRGLAKSLFEEASRSGTPIVFIELVPGGAAAFLKEIKDLNVSKTVCVMNEEAKKSLISSTGIKDKQVVVTGNPEFDVFAAGSDEERMEKRQEAREFLEVAEDEFLIDFATQPQSETDKILELTIDKLNGLMRDNRLGDKKLALLVSPHPRIRNDEKGWWKRLREIAEKFEGRVVQQGKRKSDEVRPAADLVITIYSTEGQKAVCEGIPTVYLLMEDDEFKNIITEMAGTKIPTLELGAALRVSNSGELSESLGKAISDEEVRNELKTLAARHFRTDGKATERMVGAIKRAKMGYGY